MLVLFSEDTGWRGLTLSTGQAPAGKLVLQRTQERPAGLQALVPVLRDSLYTGWRGLTQALQELVLCREHRPGEG